MKGNQMTFHYYPNSPPLPCAEAPSWIVIVSNALFFVQENTEDVFMKVRDA
jgi:hypothetical protein